MRQLSLASVLFLVAATAACTVGSGDSDTDLPDGVEVAGDEPAIVTGGDEADEETESLQAPDPDRLDLGLWVSRSSKERALTRLKLYEVDGVDVFERRSNFSAPQMGEFTLTRNRTTGQRYIKFFGLEDDFSRGPMLDKYAYATGVDMNGNPIAKLMHEPSGTQFRMAKVDAF